VLLWLPISFGEMIEYAALQAPETCIEGDG
jgi:hypothetical protein